MLRVSFLLVLLASLGLACGPAEAPPTGHVGESCDGVAATYTCSADAEAILVCNDSHIWDEELVCEDACGFSETDEGGPYTPCCLVDDETRCFPNTAF